MNNLGITVKQLKELCEKQIKKGNGDKHILISNDDEGNGFHTLFYDFADNKTVGFAYMLTMEHDGTHNVNNCVILG